MNNFTYYIPTKVLFGKGMLQQLHRELPKNARILFTYGGGSIKANGIYQDIVKELAPFQVVEFGGIDENPGVEYLEKGVKLAKENKVNWVVAAGGGSVIDASKFIAAAYYKTGKLWEIIAQKKPITKALPLATVLTLPATSSEMNHIGVISNYALKEKFSFRSEQLYPTVTVVDPTYTYSLSKQQLAYGICDSFMHVVEQYLNDRTDALVQDRFAETLLQILMEEGPKAIQGSTPEYTNRANLAWAQAWCLNGMLQMGVPTDLATHKVGHELTALYGITHAPSLIVAYPSVLQLIKKVRPQKLQQYATRVLHLTGEANALMDEAILRTTRFFTTMGISHSFAAHNLPLSAIDTVTDRFLARGWDKIGNMQDIDVKQLSAQLKRDQQNI